MRENLQNWLHGADLPTDYYELLGLARFAPDKGRILAAIRSANALLHPFQNHPNRQVVDRARRLQLMAAEAEHIFGEDEARRTYDRQLIGRLRARYESAAGSPASWRPDNLRHWLQLAVGVHQDRLDAICAEFLAAGSSTGTTSAPSVGSSPLAPPASPSFRAEAFRASSPQTKPTPQDPQETNPPQHAPKSLPRDSDSSITLNAKGSIPAAPPPSPHAPPPAKQPPARQPHSSRPTAKPSPPGTQSRRGSVRTPASRRATSQAAKPMGRGNPTRKRSDGNSGGGALLWTFGSAIVAAIVVGAICLIFLAPRLLPRRNAQLSDARPQESDYPNAPRNRQGKEGQEGPPVRGTGPQPPKVAPENRSEPPKDSPPQDKRPRKEPPPKGGNQKGKIRGENDPEMDKPPEAPPRQDENEDKEKEDKPEEDKDEQDKEPEDDKDEEGKPKEDQDEDDKKDRSKAVEHVRIDTQGSVTALGWRPDGKLLATAGLDGAISVWDAATAARSAKLEQHQDEVRALQWSSNGGQLASSDEAGGILVWDAKKWEVKGNFSEQDSAEGWEFTVAELAWLVGNKSLILGDDEGSLHILNSRTGRVTDTFDIASDAGAVVSLSVVPFQSAVRVAAGHVDGAIVVWDVGKAGKKAPRRMLLPPRGELWEKLMVQEQTAPQRRLFSKTLFTPIDRADCLEVALSPDGQRLAVLIEQIDIWNLGEPKVTLREHILPCRPGLDGFAACCWSPDGEHFAAVDDAGLVFVWKTESWRLVLRHDLDEEIYHLAWSPDGKRLAASSEQLHLLTLDLESASDSAADFDAEDAISDAESFLDEEDWLGLAAQLNLIAMHRLTSDVKRDFDRVKADVRELAREILEEIEDKTAEESEEKLTVQDYLLLQKLINVDRRGAVGRDAKKLLLKGVKNNAFATSSDQNRFGR